MLFPFLLNKFAYLPPSSQIGSNPAVIRMAGGSFDFKSNFKTKKFPIVLYGGSVNDKNIKMFSLISEIDGFLIGGASQSSKKFIDIIKNYYK